MDSTAVKAFRVGDSPAVAQYLGGVRTDYNLQRYFRDNNGVGDYYQLLEPIVLSGDFEFELSVYIDATGTFHQLLSGIGFTFNVKADDSIILFKNGYINKSFNQKVIRGSFNTIIIKRLGGLLICVVNGVSESSNQPVTNFNIQVIAGWYDYGTPSPLEGIVAGLKIWQGGDRNSDNSVLTDWYKFDNPNSAYQRNYVVAQGENLCLEEPVYLGMGWTQIVDGFTANTENYTGVMWSGAIEGETYLISCYQYDIENPGLSSSGSLEGDDWRYSEIDGVRYWLVTASSSGRLGFKADNNGIFKIKDCSIQKWSGAEIIGGMPKDWFKVERQPHWDYWLGPELSPNLTMDTDLYGWAGSGVDDGYWFWDNGRAACAGLNSYNHNIAKYGIFELGNTYRISYDGWVDNAGFGHQDGGNQVIPELTINTLVNHVEHDWVADSSNFNIKRTIGTVNNGWLDNVSIRRKLEIAQ
jgi:hypothetical protein